ncbi:hypothetical protein GCM10009677_17060 [Sphaerisporangium rubeum]|uniref:Uncharacterized protein n=1 Tax=Sphaerisporangium rubeum TaxID=321317 RepID=A0A7X0MA76_9ACTN|nr:hypothetical protein [Sphaerisporangium rubeum]MBB6475789.1 hypothetical protein [Sphaerisporangium rubeum]
MITLGKKTTTVLQVVALVAIAGQALAFRYEFKAPYTCQIPNVGPLEGSTTGYTTLTPGTVKVGTPTSIALAVKAPIDSPEDINSWHAAIDIDVTGPENVTVTTEAKGGHFSGGDLISMQLNGTWTPTKPGTYELRPGKATVTGDVQVYGQVTINCTPDDPGTPFKVVTVG